MSEISPNLVLQKNKQKSDWHGKGTNKIWNYSHLWLNISRNGRFWASWPGSAQKGHRDRFRWPSCSTLPCGGRCAEPCEWDLPHPASGTRKVDLCGCVIRFCSSGRKCKKKTASKLFLLKHHSVHFSVVTLSFHHRDSLDKWVNGTCPYDSP